ncbi:MAG: IS4 family transposase [Pseudomonadota bacterium]
MDSGWKSLLSRLGSTEDLEASAKASGALVRRREIKSAEDLLRLALAYGPCGMSLRSVAAWAATIGMGELSDVAAMKRLQASAEWLQGIVGDLLARRLTCSTAASTGRIIRLVDSTTISERGSDRADWRLHYSYDPRRGRTVDCELTTAGMGEHLRRVKVTAGDIWLGDRNYAKGEGLHHVAQAGGDFVVRASWNSLSLRTADGRPFDMATRLDRLGKAEHAEWRAVAHTPDGKTIPVRLLVRRKPPEAIEREIKRITEKAARRGRTRRSGKPDPRSLAAAQFTVLATSLAEPADQVFDLYRLRWQIEIAFKRLKSLLHIDQLPAKDPDLVRTWLLAHIIAALLIEDHADEVLDSPPSAHRYAV